MTTNREWLYSLDVADLSDWFDAEHVDNARSAKRAAAVERLKNSEYHTALDDVCAMLGWGHEPHFEGATAALIDLLTDEPMDAQQDNNGTCPNGDETASNHSKAQSKMEPSLTEQSESLSDANDDLAPESDVIAGDVDANDGFIDLDSCTHGVRTFASETDSREKLEADARDLQSRIWDAGSRHDGISMSHIIELLDRQAAIIRKTEQAAWIQQANGLIHEANVERDELRGSLDTAKQLIEQYKADGVDNLRKIDELRDELAKRDKGIERLKRQRDTARAKIDELHAECDTCCYKTDYIEMDFYDVERLEAERDNLAADLQDCERQRERLRQALGTAIDHAHEIVSLVNLDGEVIG